MTTKVVPGVLIASPDATTASAEAAGRFARHIREALRDRGVAHIALSGGTAPLDAYRRLAKEAFDWSKVHVWWVDERAVPPDHERSNYRTAKETLLDAAGIPEANVHRMMGEAGDLAAAAGAYESSLRDEIASKVGGIPALDLLVMGIGDDGHTASLFPGEPTVGITDRLVAAVPAAAEREARLTLTAPVLESARASVFVVLGAKKHPALERIWAANGDVKTTPGRVVKSFRGAVTWVIDRAAGGL